MSKDLIESGPTQPFTAIELAGTGSNKLHAVLAGANERGRRAAISLLDDWLPDTPHDGRSREAVAPRHGQAGELFVKSVTADKVLGVLDQLDPRDERVILSQYGDEMATTLAIEPFLFPAAWRGSRRTLNVAKVARSLNNDTTLQLRGLDLIIPELATLTEAIERATAAGTMIVGFVGGQSTLGLGRHADIGEIWAVQLEGVKDWALWEPSIRWHDERRPAAFFDAAGDAMNVRMCPGDTLVLPRSHLHQVNPSGSLSVGLSIVLNAPTRAELYESYLSTVGDRSVWLEPIHSPESTVPTTSGEDAVLCSPGQLVQELARFRAAIAPRHMDGAAATMRAGIDGEFETTVFRSVAGGGVHPVDYRPWCDTFVIAGGGRVMKLSRRSLPLLATLFSGREFRIEDLAYEGSIQDAAALVDDLVAEGLLAAVSQTNHV